MRITTFALLITFAGLLTACGAANLSSEDAVQELHDCRRLANADACVALAQRHVDGDGADRDLARANELLTRACRNDRREGCYHLGVLGLTQAESGIPVADVVESFERSCRRYNVSACDSLILLLEDEEGGAYDPSHGQAIRDRLCADGFDRFCFTDSDEDGVVDDEDGCLEIPEDADGFEDDDGCPDTDNDQDGILDGDDGCPDTAEDADGFEDGDGCPDTDNDQDGILDADDGCPDIAEDVDEFEDEDGCADFDNDQDGILDGDDTCPNEPEDYDGFEDRDGCPEEGEGLVALTCEAIEIRDAVYFGSGSDVIQERSYNLLDQVADVLQSVAYIRLLEVAGHTDDRGNDEGNLSLSEARANAVLSYLTDAGVSADRLRAAGYGETNPIADNGSSEGRATNRRVEFRIVEQDAGCAD